MYAIICDARRGASLGISVLAMVDRSKVRDRWWTSNEPHDAMRFRSKAAAERVAGRLEQNNARVVPFDYAEALLTDQAETIDERKAMEAQELGLDEHGDR